MRFLFFKVYFFKPFFQNDFKLSELKTKENNYLTMLIKTQ